ncbi:MAG: hypothetical protein WDM85_16925 [Caulobacteraceae bacterium]
MLVADHETPPTPGVTPTPYPDAGDNLQYAGAYWLTWFGLAGAVAGVYAAMLWRRTPPQTRPMNYVSTRGAAPPVSFLDAVLAGLAPDGGLYVPKAGRRSAMRRSRRSPADPTPRSPPR